MDGDTFNPDYFQYLLSSLTLNSRALITELTTAAEKFSEHAEEIVGLVEERIKKSLPKHKLFAIYLMDSICKNIGNPYNLIFGARLYKIFTESYLYVTDTPTRQSLIDLFKTWAKARTSAGLELFPNDVLQKIESFIIKATSISLLQSSGPQVYLLQPEAYVTRDMILREGNYLLQFVIALNTEVDKYPYTETMKSFQTKNDLIRNVVILRINEISELTMSLPRPMFDSRGAGFHNELLELRKRLDHQVAIQKEFLTQEITRASSSRRGSYGNCAQASTAAPIQQTPPIVLDTNIDIKFFSNWSVEISQDDELSQLIKDWGMPVKVVAPSVSATLSPPPSQQQASDPASPANALGMNITMMNFMDSMLTQSNSTSEPYISPEVDEEHPGISIQPSPELEGEDDDEETEEDAYDGNDDNLALYNPQEVTDEALKVAIPRFNGVMPPSSLKRLLAAADDRKIKRVRFADGI